MSGTMKLNPKEVKRVTLSSSSMRDDRLDIDFLYDPQMRKSKSYSANDLQGKTPCTAFCELKEAYQNTTIEFTTHFID